MMHFCHNLSLSLYRTYLVTKEGILMPPLAPSHLNTSFTLSCHMSAVEIQALMLALKKGGHPIWSEVKEQKESCVLVPCRASPGSAAQVRTELQLKVPQSQQLLPQYPTHMDLMDDTMGTDIRSKSAWTQECMDDLSPQHPTKSLGCLRPSHCS